MSKSKLWFRRISVFLPVIYGFASTASVSWAGLAQGGAYILTKDLWGASGSPYLRGGLYTLGYAFGEHMAGFTTENPNLHVGSGYYAGRLGNGERFRVVRTHVGSGGIVVDGIPVGIPLEAEIEIELSDQAQEGTIAPGLSVSMVRDHLSRVQEVRVPAPWRYDPSGRTIWVSPSPLWQGNTLYEIEMTPELQSIDGFPLDRTTHVRFLTLLDHHEDNEVLHPIDAGRQAFSISERSPTSPRGPLTLHIPAESLSNLATVLVSRDPLTSPLRVDPQIIAEANQKAMASESPYTRPLAVQEINAYDIRGQLMNGLSKTARLTLTLGDLESRDLVSAIPPIRTRTLSLRVLDETHRLWVKIPASQVDLERKTVTAPFTRFSVFALMGNADGSAADAFVFPNPWRPHGPQAGNGSGQTGTESGGMIFTNLPSECSIRVYTLSGELVRDLHHSDVISSIAQERWDGTTTHGDHVASGVYLWRVESSMDGKNGKLMIIR